MSVGEAQHIPAKQDCCVALVVILHHLVGGAVAEHHDFFISMRLGCKAVDLDREFELLPCEIESPLSPELIGREPKLGFRLRETLPADHAQVVLLERQFWIVFQFCK